MRLWLPRCSSHACRHDEHEDAVPRPLFCQQNVEGLGDKKFREAVWNSLSKELGNQAFCSAASINRAATS